MSSFSEIPWFAWIPILAIVLGIASGTITKVMELSLRHRERMAMIRIGMHPDAAATDEHVVAGCKPGVEVEV